MSFFDNLTKIQKELKLAGYELVNEPYGFLEILKESKVHDCEIIAKKDYYKIIYLEVESNWRGIATAILKDNPSSCMVITKYKDEHIFCSVLKDHTTLHPKPRHILIDTESNNYSWSKFTKSIKVNSEDITFSIDEKIQSVFDKFSDYSNAVKKFGENLECIINKTKKMIDDAIVGNSEYNDESKKILKMCKEVINSNMESKDIQDMLLQHILTYRIFALVYDEQNFHNTNTVAKSLEHLKNILYIDTSEIKYDKMELIAESITDSDQRQEFLKKFYEIFYKKHDPDKAEKDGIVYTPNEIVNFMVKSTDQLLKKYFKKSLSDENITILDPATGTGTFPVHILKEISIDKLESKYTKDIHANEISILPYYVATLNIEHTYKELAGKHKEFENICWMDTLDSGIKDYKKLTSYIEDDDNVKRISRQQKSKIHVIIGNPPYRGGQKNANDANKSKEYPHIDTLIKKDYLKHSQAKKHQSHDMYKRFLKWSSNRIKNEGIIAFISNNSFLDGKSDDGTRFALYNEFDYIYVVNLKGKFRDVSGEELLAEGENVFDIQTGITISFLIKTNGKHSEIQYAEVEDCKTKVEKLDWLDKHSIDTLEFKKIIPDNDAVWIHQTDDDFDNLIPLLPRQTQESIFEHDSYGSQSNKDEWVYDFDNNNLQEKMKYYTSFYNKTLEKFKIESRKINLDKWVNKKIKWSGSTLDGIEHKHHIVYSAKNIKSTLYRPFVIKHHYYDKIITHRMRYFPHIFKNSQNNLMISFQSPKSNAVFGTLGSNLIVDSKMFGGSQNIPIWVYDDKDKKHSNVTRYGLDLFRNYYENPKISDEDIFYYVYAIFNDPKYEKEYKYDLRRKFPRIPLVKNFQTYSNIGKQLFNIHCNFNNVSEYNLKRTETKTTKNKNYLKLIVTKQNDDTIIKIKIDNETTLEKIPVEVLEYTLVSKSPLWWILNYYKESKNHMSKDKGSNSKKIRERFSTYNLINYKEELIILLKKVTTVCVETVKLRKELNQLAWGSQPKLEFTPIAKKSTKKSKSTKKELEIKIKPKPKSKIIKPKKTKSLDMEEYL